jgi:hypothetical protein
MLQLHEEMNYMLREFSHLPKYTFKEPRIKFGTSIGDGSTDP